jgi:mono/diheme cytochrome c family protein
MKSFALKIVSVLFLAAFMSCGGKEANSSANQAAKPKSMLAEEPDPMTNKGIGPVTEVKLDAQVDQALADKGKVVYDKMCTACHKPTEKFIGPAPKGILERRSPEWIMNMILNPEQMVKEDPIAKKLLMEFNGSPMANQHLTQDEARAVLEYFRTL